MNNEKIALEIANQFQESKIPLHPLDATIMFIRIKEALDHLSAEKDSECEAKIRETGITAVKLAIAEKDAEISKHIKAAAHFEMDLFQAKKALSAEHSITNELRTQLEEKSHKPCDLKFADSQTGGTFCCWFHEHAKIKSSLRFLPQVAEQIWEIIGEILKAPKYHETDAPYLKVVLHEDTYELLQKTVFLKNSIEVNRGE